MRRQPARLAATFFSGASFCDLVSTASWLVDPHLTGWSGYWPNERYSARFCVPMTLRRGIFEGELQG
jgi:hypothetical protein